MKTPNRGEIWLVDLGYAAKTRPCFILSIPTEDEERALVTLIPHTTSPRQTRFEVMVKVKFLKEGVFDAQSIITVPISKLIRRLGELKQDELDEVEDVVCYWLGL